MFQLVLKYLLYLHIPKLKVFASYNELIENFFTYLSPKKRCKDMNLHPMDF